MEKIDAHCHFWSLERGDYGWLSPDNAALTPIYRDFGPAEMKSLAAAAGVSRYVAVQAAPTEAETRYLLDLASKYPEIAGVVGWVDLTTADAAERIADLARNQLLKGIRPMLQDLAEDDWINTAPTDAALAALAASSLRFDALVLPRHLMALEPFILAHPTLPVVIDHAAKPALGAAADDPRHQMWTAGMERLAAIPHVHCKLSGLLTEMRPDQYAGIDKAISVLRPYVTKLLEWFGPDRLIWGSDWPVLTLAGPHDFWVTVAQSLLSDLTANETAAIFGGNAKRFYGLDEVMA
ncbi:amidohydrolase family protein [Rhizobium sp. RU36D]|uniref:amidohydrolase family protein n=1 Tax=Rhizobium sp. RU36D TaxID=1907415 RepID=UPI0009D8C7AA|nr:amidohydrolase family protein [Rhizobium sp. RU36D]SMC44782.1 L-fuconolactonase [Rhizobium sp. RU36D]